MNDVVKTCGQCGASKSISEFHKDKTKKFGVTSACKVCAKSISKDYYYKNSEHIKRRVTCYNESYVPKYSRDCLLYTSPSPRDRQKSRMPSSA